METVYKVVRESNHRLLSIQRHPDFTLEYKVGVKVTPPKVQPNALIFAFRSFEDALEFSLDNPEADRIHEAAATETFDPPECIPMLIRDMYNYWYGADVPYTMPTPKGTILCSDITLIREMNFQGDAC